MKINPAYLFLVVLLTGKSLFSQVKEFGLNHAGCQNFRGNVYVYGLKTGAENTMVAVYKLDSLLRKSDSTFLEMKNIRPEDFLNLYSDTLHNYLNIYLQEKEKKVVTILRYNRLFERVSLIESVDVARLNNAAMFENDVLYKNSDVFTIRIENDSAGKQFYLNKYSLKSEHENFDYQFKWQFPFERRNIQSAHIFYASAKYVYLFVHRNAELPGQWILQIESATGKFIRGTKLNDKGETNTYEFGNFEFVQNKRSLFLTGQKFDLNELRQGEKKLNLSKQNSCTIFFCEIDSVGDVKFKQEFKIPVVSGQGGKKTGGGYFLRIGKPTRNPRGGLSLLADVYRNQAPEPCYRFVNTIPLEADMVEDKLVLKKTTVTVNTAIEDLYLSTDKLDMNGKLCPADQTYIDRIFFDPLTSPAKLEYKTDTAQNPMWLLTRSDLRKNMVRYFMLRPVKKIYRMEEIGAFAIDKNPAYRPLKANSFVVGQQRDPEIYELKLFFW